MTMTVRKNEENFKLAFTSLDSTRFYHIRYFIAIRAQIERTRLFEKFADNNFDPIQDLSRVLIIN